MSNCIPLTISKIEKSEIKGILILHLTGANGSHVLGELPEKLIGGKISPNDKVALVLSSSPLSIDELSKRGQPLILCEGIVYKKVPLNDKVRYWISIHGLQFRIETKTEVAKGIEKVWIGIVKQA